ncbi:MAG: hypothetical protein AAGG75_03815 [Bacteroidota bacterium]
MKNLPFIIAAIVLSLSLSSCSRNFYTKANFSPSKTGPMTIAVLPYKIVTTGRIPRNVTPEDLQAIEEAESQAFQISMYNQVLRRMNRSRKKPAITVQHFNETNNMLTEAGVRLSESWKKSPKELTKLLGVDAVLFSVVHKNQYLTNLESYGLHLAASLITVFANRVPWYLPNNRTSDVRISSSIIDGKDGTTIWAVARNCPTYWNRNTYDAIEKINFRVTKRIPLR